MSFNFTTELVTLWGNEDARSFADEILYKSEQLTVVKFKLFINDPLFSLLEQCCPHMPNVHRHEFVYIHKSNGIYYYTGKIERSKIKKISRGVAEIEIVVLKNSSENRMSKPRKYYPCATKNDVCVMNGWPILGDDKIRKIIKQTIHV
jgi:hypothetical protein